MTAPPRVRVETIMRLKGQLRRAKARLERGIKPQPVKILFHELEAVVDALEKADRPRYRRNNQPRPYR